MTTANTTRSKPSVANVEKDLFELDSDDDKKVTVPQKRLPKPESPQKKPGKLARMQSRPTQPSQVSKQEIEDLFVEEPIKPVVKPTYSPKESPKKLSAKEEHDLVMEYSINAMLKQTSAVPTGQIKEIASMIGNFSQQELEPPASAMEIFGQRQPQPVRTYAARNYASRSQNAPRPKSLLSQVAEEEVVEVDEGLGQDEQTKVTSYNELKAAGELRKFLDGIEYTLDGFKVQDKSIRRSTALELAIEMCKDDFREKMTSHGYPVKVLTMLKPIMSEDVVLQLLVVVLMMLSLKDTMVGPNLLKEDIVQILLEASKTDPLNPLWGMNASTQDWKRVKEISKFLQDANLPTSMRGLILETFSSLTVKGNKEFIRQLIRENVFQMVSDELQEDTMVEGACFQLLETFSMVDQDLISQWALKHLPDWTVKVVEEGDVDLMQAVLKTLINLTNDNRDFTRQLGQTRIPALVVKILLSNQEKQLYNLYVLSIALLVNLVTHIGENRNVIQRVQVGKDCKCKLECHCKNKSTVLSPLVDLYIQFAQKNQDEQENVMLVSYQCLLLACLIRDNPENLKVIKPLLPNQSLEPIIQQLKTFANYQRLLHDTELAEKVAGEFMDIVRDLEKI